MIKYLRTIFLEVCILTAALVLAFGTLYLCAVFKMYYIFTILVLLCGTFVMYKLFSYVEALYKLLKEN